MMNIHIHVWADAFEDFKKENIPSGDTVLYGYQLESLTDRFDLMITSNDKDLGKVLHVATLGSGFKVKK